MIQNPCSPRAFLTSATVTSTVCPETHVPAQHRGGNGRNASEANAVIKKFDRLSERQKHDLLNFLVRSECLVVSTRGGYKPFAC